MLRLLTLLLLLFPSLALGQTVKLPAEIVAKGKLVLVSPEFEPGQPLQTEFVVFGDKKAPEFATFGSTLLVAEPDVGDEITVVCVAVFEGSKLAKPAVTRIKPRGATPGGTTPTTPTTPAANIPATGLAVIMVVELGKVPVDIEQLAKGQNAITQNLARRQGAWYVRNSTDSLVAALKPSFESKPLPVLIVINTSTKQVVLAESFTPLGDAGQTAQAIIQRITPK